ncbi:hypothetical protein ACEQ8H_008790 [Pleosporales sp. CAS-2024a]
MSTTHKKKPMPAPLTAPHTKKKTQHIATPASQQSWLTRATSSASSALSSTTSAAASGVGKAAGAVVTAAGNGVAGAGKGAGVSIVNTSRSWGDMVRDYGNSIKDVTGAPGRRAPTRTNPLGLAT